MKLSTEEKSYLWSKMEYRKKQTSIKNKDGVYNLLMLSKEEFEKEEIDLIVSCLEYRFKKRINGIDSPLKNELFNSIRNKYERFSKEIWQCQK